MPTEHDEYSGVEQILLQGWAISPLPFNIFFAAVLTVIIHRCSSDAGILGHLAHLSEGVQQEGVGGYGRRTSEGDEGSVGHAVA